MALRIGEQLCRPCSSTATFCVDAVWGDGFTEWQGQSPIPLGQQEPKKSQSFLTTVCLQIVSCQQKKVTKFLFFLAKRAPPPLFFLLLGSSNWELVYPCTSCADPCNLCTSLSTKLPSHSSPCTSNSNPKGRFASTWANCCVWAMISCFGLGSASYLSSK